MKRPSRELVQAIFLRMVVDNSIDADLYDRDAMARIPWDADELQEGDRHVRHMASSAYRVAQLFEDEYTTCDRAEGGKP